MVEINGKPVRPADTDHRQIVLAFDADRGTYSGMSGCNELSGWFETTDAPLTFRSKKLWPICGADEQTERAVRTVFNETRAYRVTSTTLELLNAKGERLARLER